MNFLNNLCFPTFLGNFFGQETGSKPDENHGSKPDENQKEYPQPSRCVSIFPINQLVLIKSYFQTMDTLKRKSIFFNFFFFFFLGGGGGQTLGGQSVRFIFGMKNKGQIQKRFTIFGLID